MKISQTKDIRSANRLTIIKYIQDQKTDAATVPQRLLRPSI